MPHYNQPHQFYDGALLHARSRLVYHLLRTKTVFDERRFFAS